METKEWNNLTDESYNIFSKLAKSYEYNGIDLVMIDVVPQRGRILSEMVSEGATAYMAGGKDGQQFFSNVPQFTLPFDTFTTRGADAIPKIASAIPQNLVRDKSAVFVYVPMGNNISQKELIKRTGTSVVATNEQNLRGYFEEKANLTDILKAAGLEEHIIPSQMIKTYDPLTSIQSKFLYEKYANEDGKVVIQYCGEGCTEKGGGYSTIVIDNLDDFRKIACEQRDSQMKVATFISGSNSNLSICAGNLVPAQSAQGTLGAVKCNLEDNESRYSPETLTTLQQRAQQLGINEDNTFVCVQPGTLKVVGAKELTSSITNGVGNQLNYNYSQEILDKIYNIGDKLGSLMASCGKVGLCGTDLIIDKTGHIYINEINDRQQGPTESAGLNNEAHGLPGIHRTAFFLNFADISNPQVNSYLTTVKENSRELYDRSLEIPSPFYIKFITKYAGYIKQDLNVGNYEVTADNNGHWHWDLKNPTDKDLEPVNLNNGTSVVRIDTVSAKQGDFFPQETQLARINGTIDKNSTSPFAISEEGLSVLSPEWVEPIEELYKATVYPAQASEEVDVETLESSIPAPANTTEHAVNPADNTQSSEYLTQLAGILYKLQQDGYGSANATVADMNN